MDGWAKSPFLQVAKNLFVDSDVFCNRAVFHGAYNNSICVIDITHTYVVVSRLDMVGKRPMRSVASKSLGSTTVMCMVLVLMTGRSGVGSWRLVDLMFFLGSLPWPFSVAKLFGRCFDMSSAVSPVHVEKLPLLIAVIIAVGAGGNAARLYT